jgi:hypothetical protein
LAGSRTGCVSCSPAKRILYAANTDNTLSHGVKARGLRLDTMKAILRAIVTFPIFRVFHTNSKFEALGRLNVRLVVVTTFYPLDSSSSTILHARCAKETLMRTNPIY